MCLREIERERERAFFLHFNNKIRREKHLCLSVHLCAAGVMNPISGDK